MSAELLRFEKRSRSRISGHRLTALLAIVFIVVYAGIALGTLLLGSPAIPGTTALYPGL